MCAQFSHQERTTSNISGIGLTLSIHDQVSFISLFLICWMAPYNKQTVMILLDLWECPRLKSLFVPNSYFDIAQAWGNTQFNLCPIISYHFMVTTRLSPANVLRRNMNCVIKKPLFIPHSKVGTCHMNVTPMALTYNRGKLIFVMLHKPS